MAVAAHNREASCLSDRFVDKEQGDDELLSVEDGGGSDLQHALETRHP